MTEHQKNRNVCAVGKASEGMTIDTSKFDIELVRNYLNAAAAGHLSPLTPPARNVADHLARIERLKRS
ncbi:TPA: hypothetical protein L2G87_004790 [Escherichia coli O25b:H4-ST131]|nr:hypothetical protein [Salmonella enterica]HAF4711017.1 hypothetical protein [Salmonella enterica]HBN3635420.1 hypothetical protein [Escherichia coli O25b:H4-ST131]